MALTITHATVRSILTRASGYLRPVASHSLNPYRGCTFGRALCGVGCYVQHNTFLTREQPWGTFLEVRVNAAETYARQHARELAWARRVRGQFTIFMASSTDPFLPQEDHFRVTHDTLQAMIERPPDDLIVQTHTHRVLRYQELYPALARVCRLRFHISIESDRDRLPGLPPPASSVEDRFAAAAALRAAGLRVVITVSPLFPIAQPRAFFERAAAAADAVVIDHFIGGDGSNDGGRTLRTRLPAAMRAIDGSSTTLEYRDRMVATARAIMPGRVGVAADGFAGHFT